MFGLCTIFTITPEIYFAVFFIVQLYIQFPVTDSGGAGLLYSQSLILDVPVPDGFFLSVFSDLTCLKKSESSTVGGLLYPCYHVICKFLSVCLLPNFLYGMFKYHNWWQ